VTVCVAAMSDGGDRVFGASDRMLTGRDVEFEPSQTKILGLTRSIAILVAGDTAMQIEVLHKVRADVKARVQAEPDNWWNVSDVADLYSRYYNEARSRRSENAILAPLGLSRTSHLDRQQQLSSELVIQIADKLTKYESPRVQAIVMGVDTTGGHIYVCDNGTITCQDAVGFASIGIGYWHANSQFMFGGHTKYKAMPETLLMTYFAKKRAELGIFGPTLSTLVGQLSALGKHRVLIVSHTFHFLSICDSSWRLHVIIAGWDPSECGKVGSFLLNFRPQMGVFRCNCEVSNANKTNAIQSVRTGQDELANRCN
jgi:hypothetical protein